MLSRTHSALLWSMWTNALGDAPWTDTAMLDDIATAAIFGIGLEPAKTSTKSPSLFGVEDAQPVWLSQRNSDEQTLPLETRKQLSSLLIAAYAPLTPSLPLAERPSAVAEVVNGLHTLTDGQKRCLRM